LFSVIQQQDLTQGREDFSRAKTKEWFSQQRPQRPQRGIFLSPIFVAFAAFVVKFWLRLCVLA
jgi:hypothetical protein